MSMNELDVVKALQPPIYTNKETGKVYTGRLMSLMEWLALEPDRKKLADKTELDMDYIAYIHRVIRIMFPYPARTTKPSSIKFIETVRQYQYVASLKTFDDPVNHIMADPEILTVFTDFLEYQTSVLFKKKLS